MRNIGAAAGGLLGLALLPLAVANADNYIILPDATSVETITGLYGHGFDGADTAPPAVTGSIQGEQLFSYTDTTTNATGTFYGFESVSNDGLGDINTEVYVAPTPETGYYSGAGGTDAPPVGSVFDSYSYGNGAGTSVYSAIPDGHGTATVTDTLVSSTGNVSAPTTFDAADGPAVYAAPVIIGNSGTMQAIGSQTVTSISGIPPLTAALQGTQDFSFFNSAGTLVGTVGTVDTTTSDGAGTFTEAVLVTNDLSGTVGATGADIPAAGSIYNTIDFYGSDNIYSDIVTPSGNHFTDTLQTSMGTFIIPVAFDAAKAETISNSPVSFSNGMTFTPTDALNFTGINGLPPVDVGIQGGQDFSFTDGTLGSGTFTADVTNTLDDFNDQTEAILVTQSSDPAVLPVGSEFEIVNFGYGFESLYSDIASAGGQNVITETLVTPLGDISLPPPFDAAAGLFSDMFSVFAGGGAL
ncbi:hypothetical protein GCM10009641_83490 [Mycobacterium cookii]|uniref:Uncharacterized protein n=1 Tax=Mycobacterium cookii TaxID=1775 RepID=A0A7I7KRL8_9MYCO|nr:hypothetical protein [Mycobacterium cookii]MCV7331795.1 hypothetical protein [Mycobacterium cookii]BBX44359.1 hypothetical protein MCOO_03740 [Mycobacterium cookii]